MLFLSSCSFFLGTGRLVIFARASLLVPRRRRGSGIYRRRRGWARAAPVCAYLVWSSPSLPRSGSNSPGRSINAAVSQNVNVLLKMFLSISVSVNRVAFFSRSRYFGKNHIRFSISPMKLGQADSRFLPTKCRNPPSLLSPLCTDSSPYVVKPHKI